MLRLLAAPLLSLCLATATATSAAAQGVAPVDTLFRAMGLPDILQIMREEGLAYGKTLEADLFTGAGGESWGKLVDEIYDLDRMTATVRNRLDSELAARDLAPMIDFYTSDRGREIVALEVSARRALMDEAVEEAAKARLAEMLRIDAPRLRVLRSFAESADLIEHNVVGALNANYAFYTGLVDGGAFDGTMTEEEILTDIWSQEDTVRADTHEWLYSYLVLAFQPLATEDIEAYAAFNASEAGAVLNRALFAAFDEMYEALSLALGHGAARFIGGAEL